MKKYLPFFVLIFFVSLIGISTYKLSKTQEIVEGGIIDGDREESRIHFNKTKIILPEFTLNDLFEEGKKFTKKDLIGKYSVINFFASWCTTCRMEHQILMNLKAEGIAEVYGVAFRDIDENTKAFLSEHGNPFHRVAKDSKGIFTDIIGLKAVPETVIVDPNGDIVMRYRGNLQEFSVDEIREFVTR
jgi:cytochrome c biogenesis protein CcmG/thiol:disulfide interchange protein DsbE